MTTTTPATHTPEPWTFLEDDEFSAIVSEAGTPRPYVAWLNTKKPDEEFVGCGGDWKANANRIVACVNACAGINPEAVPMTLEALRDVLAVADFDHRGRSHDAYMLARAAIALATPDKE